MSVDKRLDPITFKPSTSRLDTFEADSDGLFDIELPKTVDDINTVLDQINDTETNINEKEASAVSSAQVAVSAANFKGIYTTQTTQVGESYLWNGATYMVLVAGNTSPTTSPSNWMLIPKINSVNGFTPDASGNVKVEATKGTAIASASTITIGTAGLGDTIHITGTTTITSLGVCTGGIKRTLIFDGILTLTHNATSLILPDATNIITAVGDSAEFVCDTTNNWKLLRYTRASISVTEIDYLNGVSSNIQTQINAKQTIVQGTVVNSTSGTSIDFTDIPSWVKKITIMFDALSTSGTSYLRIQLGSSTIQNTGYRGTATRFSTSAVASANFTAGFDGYDSSSAGDLRNGQLIISKLTSNTWCISGSYGLSNSVGSCCISGSVSLAGALDRIRTTTVNGTDTVDGGQINIIYEG